MSQPRRRRIILMRHGSVTYFDGDGNPVDPNAVSLNEQGRAQATAAGKALAIESAYFDRVIVSGLPRTIETAQRVLAEIDQDIRIEHWPEMEEIRGGRLSAIPDAMLTEAFTAAFTGVAAETTRFLGGETVGQLMDRVHRCIDRLRGETDWDTALLVMHGGVNRAILSYALTGQRLFLGNLAQSGGCINILDVGVAQTDWVVRVVNYCALSALQDGTRGTTMETMLAQYRKSRQP